MIWLALVAFVAAALVGGFIVRWVRGHAALYGHGMPQRFHLGHVPRLGGVAILAGTSFAWLLGLGQMGLGRHCIAAFWWLGAAVAAGAVCPPL